MTISRRHLLRRMGAGAAMTAAMPTLSESALRAAWTSAGASRAGAPIRLNRNENAYGPSAKVIATLRDSAPDAANRYPDGETEALRQAIAGAHAVAPERVVLGCGSREILRMAAEAFSRPGTKVIVALPTFEVMSAVAARAGAEVVAVPLTKEHSHDLPAMLARCDAATRLVYICNPNNPTGSLTHRQDLEAFLRRLPASVYVLIDEAYHHFVSGSLDYASFIDRPVHDDRVIVTRSFSKIHGLAGVRIGYAVAAEATARRLASCRLPDAVNGVAALAASTALGDLEHVRLSVRRNADDRQEFFNQAISRMLKAIDSHTNFVMLNTERRSVDVIEHFTNHQVLIAGPVPSFDKHVRVTIGTPAEMREFWRVWDLQPVIHKMSM